MVGGTIVDFYKIQAISGVSYEVRFLVRGTGIEQNDHCCVRADIPFSVYPELKVGDPIWWHSKTVFLTVFGEEDAKFPKIGFSGGDATTFYERKKKAID